MVAESLTYSPYTISIYFHWPFCASKCPYCDFNSFASQNPVDYKLWEQAYLNELKKYTSLLKNKTITSIFFGGGTPSLMDPQIVHNLVSYIKSINNSTVLSEITLESNPSSIETQKLQAFKAAGVNRISIGVQSFNEFNLKILKRNHTVKEAIKAISTANEIFNRVSFDLINGLPNQSLRDWQTELSYAKSFISSHVSIYELTIEPGTPFFNQKVLPPNADTAINMFNYTQEYLSALGIYPYEISNYSKPNEQSLHNLQYWEGGLYLGIGPGAHGRIIKNGKIYATMGYKNPIKWLEAALHKQNVYSENYALTKEQRIYELFILNLRLYKEISPLLYNYIKTNTRSKLVKEELLVEKNNKLYLTPKARLKLNLLVEYFVKELDIQP